MKTDAAIEFFGSAAALARAAAVSRQAVTRWIKTGKVPIRKALDLEQITAKRLKAAVEDYR